MAKEKTGPSSEPVKSANKDVGRQPRSANDDDAAKTRPNPDRDVQGDTAEVQTITHTPGS